MIVFLYRPSPQVPEPSEQAAEKCFDASVRNVHMQSTQIARKSVDLTWIFTQALFMALNTILWSLSYPAIRRQHPLEEVIVHLGVALKSINHTSERWPGVRSAVQLYQILIRGCLKAYSSGTSYVIRSPPSALEEASLSSRALSDSPARPLAPSLAASPTPQSHHDESHEEASIEYQDADNTPPDQNDYFADLGNGYGVQHQLNDARIQHHDGSRLLQSSSEQPSTLPIQFNENDFQSRLPASENYGMTNLNPDSVTNEFSSTIPDFPHWDSTVTPFWSQSAFGSHKDVTMDTKPWLGSFGDEYSRCMHQAYYAPQQQIQSLSQQQQLELMAALEQDQLPDVSKLISDAATFYTGNIL